MSALVGNVIGLLYIRICIIFLFSLVCLGMISSFASVADPGLSGSINISSGKVL